MMQVTTPQDVLRTPVAVFQKPRRHEGGVAEGTADPSYRAFELLYVSNILLPFIIGLGQLTGALVNWARVVHPAFVRGVAAGAAPFLRATGVIEIALAALVAFKPRWGGYAVALWLWAGILDFALTGGHYGLCVACAALSAGAVATAWLAKDYYAARRP